MTDEIWLAIITLISGAIGSPIAIKLISIYTGRSEWRLKREDRLYSMLNKQNAELKEEIKGLKTEIIELRGEIEKWKSKYYIREIQEKES